MDGGMISKAILGDCMDVMREYPDKYFDLAVVDPPYGGGGDNFKGQTRFGGHFAAYKSSEDRREVGGKVCKKNRELGLCPRRGLF